MMPKKVLNFTERLTMAKEWLEQDNELTFVAVYYEQPDEIEHEQDIRPKCENLLIHFVETISIYMRRLVICPCISP